MRNLVTGGGGFLGSAVVRMLIERGETVRSFSRKKYPKLAMLGAEQHRGDLADAKAVAHAAEGCDMVYHIAGKPGAWGPYQSYYNANVLGTEHVLNACRQHGIRYLVYTSSPSVVFTGSDMEGADESVPYAEHYQAHYPKTKAEAERKVLAANSPELQTTALRPHLIWGPRDPNLTARIVARGRAGQLRRIGGGPKLVDTVYIDDAARAHLLAADRLRETPSKPAGKVYFISSGQPVDVWEMADRILAAAGLPPVKRSISPKAAYAAGWLLEMIYGALRIKNEPRMTRWVAEQLSNAHWFDISAARQDLGYEPQINLEEGLSRLKAWFASGAET